ncbi:hypothetical protein GDO78_002096 [Eleutherodactylus coqui]|uniref:Uncharacterized protein n=1 Tax=Eleutherodactylus coqui TaxID=57060 RepID=A0A8J6FW30_ELECQ|nr:hypothetical protein GDO78_002096 [Eleutherodactylus coqui]KAG9494582.1 hypothetical protein GDO78_002096 [Eleutherodactylus coqui]
MNTEEEAPEPSYMATAAASPPALASSTATQEQEGIITQEETSTPTDPQTDPPKTSPYNTRSRKRASDPPRLSPYTTHYRMRTKKSQNMELLETAKLVLGHRPDEFERIGQSIACTLRRISENQRIHYERVLTELNTEGLLGHLDECSVLTNRNLAA